MNKPLKLIGLILSLGLVAVGLNACASAPAQTDSTVKPVIAATTSILGDIVQNVVGEEAQVQVLMPAGSDPHNFQLSTKDISKMMTADLIIENGLGLEEGIASSLKAAKADGLNVLTAGDYVHPLAATNATGEDHAEHDDSDDHDAGDHDAGDHDAEDDHADHNHGPLDPHFWHDPNRVRELVVAITAAAQKLPGVDEVAIAQQAMAYDAQLVELDAKLQDDFAAIPEQERLLVTGHHVFGYLAEAYDFKVVATVIPSSSTMAETNAASLMRVAETLRELNIKAIFTDASQSQKTAETVVQESGLDIAVVPLYSESLTPAGGEADTYIELMLANAASIVAAI